MPQFNCRWVDGGREPTQPPDPAYPDGIDVVIQGGPKDSMRICSTTIPYPTGHANIGTWVVTCRTCGFRVTLTAASRPDDPRSLSFPCQKHKMKKGRKNGQESG